MVTEQIFPNMYKIEVPLPRSPLKALNSYVIKNEGRALMIDTGQNREECLTAMTAGIKELDIDLAKTDFFITHLHADHIGLVSSLVTSTSKVYFSRVDAAVFQSPSTWQKSHGFAQQNGFPEPELEKALRSHPGRIYSAKGKLDFHFLKEGDTISIGDYLLKCIETPGHTRGHMCLYEPNRKVFIAGDHILVDITPNITAESGEGNPLKEYLNSLDKVYSLDVDLVLPGHRSFFRDFKGRIQELKLHHQNRANEILRILKKGNQNAYQIASQMTWDVDYKSWELFPAAQKWFAFGEAVAHLNYLEQREEVRKQTREREAIYSLS